MRANQQTYNALIGAAVLVMSAITIYDLLVPKPKPMTHELVAQQIAKQEKNIAIQQADLDKASKAVNKYLWNVPANKIQSTSLDAVTAMTLKHQVTLVAFRPQKPTIQDGLVHQPYLILLDGSYPNVMSVISEIEAPERKLAVNLVQVASADPSTDRIDASVGVIAYTLRTQEATSNAGK